MSVDSCNIVAEIRTIKVGRVEASTSSQSNESTTEINNHADMTVLGSNCLPVPYFERLVDVSVWDASAGSVECPTISGAIAYDHPISGKVYMLMYHQVIHCQRLANHLMCLMKIWVEEVNINELPKFLAEDPDYNTHAIIVYDPLNTNQPLIIQLVFKGVNSYLPSRKPRSSEYEDESIPHIDMPSQEPVWEPSETSFEKQEDAMTDFRG